ncbi:MAG: hypothetical protein ACUVV0_05720 [Anaerolineae bacterium]
MEKDKEDDAIQEEGWKMEKERITIEGGRYLIYYRFRPMEGEISSEEGERWTDEQRSSSGD